MSTPLISTGFDETCSQMSICRLLARITFGWFSLLCTWSHESISIKLCEYIIELLMFPIHWTRAEFQGLKWHRGESCEQAHLCLYVAASMLGRREAALWWFFSLLGGGGEWGDVILLWNCCGREWKAAADGIVFVAAAEWQTFTTKIPPCPLCSLGSCISPCQRSAMSPGCMLLFVFGFVGGAVVINSAILVSLSVLLLVHFSISTGVPAVTQNLQRILRYLDCWIFPVLCPLFLAFPVFFSWRKETAACWFQIWISAFP